MLFYDQRKSHMLPTLDLLILCKFSLPSLGVAVSSFIYLHSNNIMKTGSGHPHGPWPWLTLPNAYLVCIKISLSPFLGGNLLSLKDLLMSDFMLELCLLLDISKSRPVSFSKKEKVTTESSKVERGSRVIFIWQHLGCEPLNGNSALIVKALARLPCCFQEALCVVSAKAIFSYGVTERRRAARSI